MHTTSTLVAICLILLAGLTQADTSPTMLSNGYFSLDVTTSGITRLQVDPAGKNPVKSMSFAKSLWPEFWQPTDQTRITADGTRATITDMAIWEYRGIATNVGTDNPNKLEPGHTLAQTFRLPEGTQLSSVEIRLPTWNSKTSGTTLNLYRDGKLVASKKLKDVQDNSWQSIAPDSPQGAGLYTAELANPVGDIGWWSSKQDVNPIGEALADGKPSDADRAIQVHTYHMVGKGRLTFSLDGSKLLADAEFTPTTDMQYKTFPWRWKTTWTKSGYDCTPKSGTVFSRFFTDNLRYLPIQWFKRRDTGAYSFDGCKWIEMDGTKDADLRLTGDGIDLHWELRPDEMHLRFDTPLVKAGDKVTSHFTLAANKRDDTVPAEYPRFSCSDKAVERDLNTFWWERGFSYPYPPNCSVEWAEWTALTRAWFDDCQRPAQEQFLLDYPMTDEGYVNTYGDIVGWPLVPNRDTRHFDSNARFILGCWRHYMWTGDTEFLRKQADRLRKAMQYQLEVLHGKDGLIVTPDFKTGRHEDLSDNYWDILPFGHLDAYANAAFYGSLNAMAQIEEALGTLNVKPPDAASPATKSPSPQSPPSRGGEDLRRDVADRPTDAPSAPSPLEGEGRGEGSCRTATDGPTDVPSVPSPLEGEGQGEGVSPQSEIRNPRSAIISPSFYRALALKSHKAYDDTFWLEDKGRYAGCVDSDGIKHDYGFTFVNLEALFYGLGDKQKAGRIYHWMETEPTSSGKADTYTKWIFAPRSTTIHNPEWKPDSGVAPSPSRPVAPSAPGPWWTYWWSGTPYGDQCQDGGAILYTSFFDLMDRAKHRSADNAWQRFMEILNRYRMPDRLCGGAPLFRGEIPQQEPAGSVGVDMPFPESGLVPLYYLYGVIGVQATPGGLRISPNLPKSLKYAGVQDILWHGAKLSIRVTHTGIEIKGTGKDGRPIIRQYAYKAGGSVFFSAP